MKRSIKKLKDKNPVVVNVKIISGLEKNTLKVLYYSCCIIVSNNCVFKITVSSISIKLKVRVLTQTHRIN